VLSPAWTSSRSLHDAGHALALHDFRVIVGESEIRSRSRSKGTLEATTVSARLVYQPPGYGREYFCKCTRCHPTVSYLCALADFSISLPPPVFQLTFCLAGISLSRSCHVTKKKKPGLFRAPGFSI
jgi:hypothetical protein